MTVNALVTRWPHNHVLYAFPPTTLMHKVLLKILKARPPRLLLVAPRLLEAQWYPLLQQLPCQLQTTLDLQPGDLLQPHWDHAHPNPALFNLQLWCIGFPHSDNVDFQMQSSSA